MNKTEWRFWLLLRDRRLSGYKFRRQHPLGRYMADFFCPKANLVVELDGPPHVRSEYRDNARKKWLVDQGYHVLRFWTSEFYDNREGVLTTIFLACEKFSRPVGRVFKGGFATPTNTQSASPSPLAPRGEENKKTVRRKRKKEG
jgi:very-short-patch-repair endonuclease